jgi:hypothetical protein
LPSDPSDYVIEEKSSVLQKRDSEGFGFVLRGAKGKEGWNVPRVRRMYLGLG